MITNTFNFSDAFNKFLFEASKVSNMNVIPCVYKNQGLAQEVCPFAYDNVGGKDTRVVQGARRTIKYCPPDFLNLQQP